MARIEFTRQLAQHVECPAASVSATTLQAAFASVFADRPQLGSYVLDDQGCIRKHVAIFIDNQLLRQRDRLDQVSLQPESQVFVMQALSGG